MKKANRIKKAKNMKKVNKMKKIIRNKIYILIFLVIVFIVLFFINNEANIINNIEIGDKLSIIINIKNITQDKHLLFYEFMKELNSTRNFYFIKNIGNPLNNEINKLVKNSDIKVVQSNFPDSIYLPLVVSLYGDNLIQFVLFIEEDDIFNDKINELVNWYNSSIRQIINNKYDYIFGNYQIINGKKIGCSLLLSKASIIQHLLYNTDSDTSHINPFIQLSLATKTKFKFFKFKCTKISPLEKIEGKSSLNMYCPSINDNSIPSLCIMIPAFKRNYFQKSFTAFSNQTYKPKFYVIIQNDNKISLNLTEIQNIVNEPVYHIWMSNWNSLFFLNHRLSSLFPCDFVFKYDDDQWPNDVYNNEKIINMTKNNNLIVGGRGIIVSQ